MLRLQRIAVTTLLALALGSPALAQRGQHGGGRGTGPSPDTGAGRAQPRDSASVVDRMLSTGRVASPNTGSGTGVPTLPGLESASLITPRPGGDVFRANPGTYGRPGGIVPRGPSWGGVPVLPSVPSWGGTPIYGFEHGKGDGARDNRGPRHGLRRQFRGGYAGGYGAVYGLPYGYVPYYDTGVATQPASATPAEDEIPEGFLRLLITPRDAAVIVDGVLAGRVDDFGGTGEQALPAGPHRIRIEAPGYEPVEFDVRVPIGDTISLRRELNPLPAPPRAGQPATLEHGAPNQAPAVRKTFYAIPRCYLGDTKPKPESLPPGCSLQDLRVLPPQ